MREFRLGTVAKVKAGDRTAYLVAISRLNANKVAESDLNGYKDALSMMWEEIRYRGTQENIVCPVLGTGLSRLPLNRMDAIRIIVRSFVAAASEGENRRKLDRGGAAERRQGSRSSETERLPELRVCAPKRRHQLKGWACRNRPRDAYIAEA